MGEETIKEALRFRSERRDFRHSEASAEESLLNFLSPMIKFSAERSEDDKNSDVLSFSLGAFLLG